MHFLRPLGGLVGLALLVCACSAPGSASISASASPVVVGSAPFIPVIVSSQAIVGQNRFLIGLLDATGQKPIGRPDTTVKVTFTRADQSGAPLGPQPAEFVWAVPDVRGIFVANVAFPSDGEWNVAVDAAGGGVPAATVKIQFQVTATGSAVAVGAKAPATTTPTAADVGGDLKQISTDPSPDATFYTTSVDEALKDHEPFVLVFATPAFCASSQCGPTLDSVKAVAKEEPGVTFIHVEPYKLAFSDGRLQPVLDANGQLQPTDAVAAWGILSEPWVYVVDDLGVVRASFEAVIAAEELKAAIDSIN